MTILTLSNLPANTTLSLSAASSEAPNTEHKIFSKTNNSLAEQIGKSADHLATQISNDCIVDIASSQTKEYEEKKRAYGASKNEFNQFLKDSNGARFAPSATAGRKLSNTNDHAGILIIVAQDQGSTIAERLVVLKENLIAENGEPEVRYLIKGYDNRIVNFQELTDALERDLEPENDKGKEKSGEEKIVLGTSFRSALRQLSEKSELPARRNEKESKKKLIPIASNTTQLPGGATGSSGVGSLRHALNSYPDSGEPKQGVPSPGVPSRARAGPAGLNGLPD